MSPVSSKRYLVRLTQVATYKVIVESPDSETAEELAMQLIEDDFDRFEHVDGSTDILDCEEVRS